jgi:CubicO group peptidase (beta-lactamase class C family)
VIAEPFAIAGQVGLSTSRLKHIGTLVQAFIDRGVIAGAVTLLARKGRIAHLSAHGQMDIESGREMRTDALFRLASMTKPVIAVAILKLFEEGKLLLNDPVSAYLPNFKDLQVSAPSSPEEFALEPALREITIKDLLTHTSGLGSALSGPCATGTAAVAASVRNGDTLADIIPKMGSVPLSFQPGAKWEYSPGFGFDTLGHIVEVISGTPIDRFLQERIFEPLGMRNTTFSVPKDRMDDLATVYAPSENGGRLQPGQPAIRMLALSTDPENRYFSGGGGLVGSAEDYALFGLMLASGGQFAGERVLSARAVELMASNHIGTLPVMTGGVPMAGYRFGLGVRVLDNPAEAATLASRGTFGWAGAFGTNSFIEPEQRMVGLLLIQRQPDLTDQTLRALWPRLQSTMYQAIDD